VIVLPATPEKLNDYIFIYKFVKKSREKMYYGEFKAPKGVIKVALNKENDRISNIRISGDFFMYPEEAIEDLEQFLVGVKIDRESLLRALKEFYTKKKVETPMVGPEHFLEAIMRAVIGGGA
jgi:hypothetical protein